MEIIEQYRDMHSALVGGKFACQARMRAIDVPVPSFFCLSKQLFDRCIAPARQQIAAILRDIEPHDRKGIAAAAAQVRALIHGMPLDDATSRRIIASIDRHLPATEFVSVRACMVSERAQSSEDSVANPFAGISETYLYVKREEVLARVKDCWACAFAEKALLYRLSLGIDLLDVSVAVGIQCMIFGQRSFVLFTCDPNTAARDTVLVAGYGIGEGIVQESVPVDHYFVNAKGGVVERVIAHKDKELTFDAVRGAGVAARIVAAERRHLPCLSDAEIGALQALGRKIEKHFDWPQDIEGTFDAHGRLHILQARPIAIDFAKKRVWTGLNITESYPGVSSPLTYSLAKLFYNVIFRDLYLRAGVPQATLHRNHLRLDRMIGYVNGRIYYSLNAFYLLHGMSPLFPWLSKAWETMVGLKTSYFIRNGEIESECGGRPKRWALAKATANFLHTFIKHPRQVRAFKQWWIGRAQRARALLKQEHDPLALTEEFYRLWRDVGATWGVTLINDAYIFTLYAVVSGLLKRWRLDQDPALLSNLLCGDDAVESVEIFFSILRLAEYIRTDAAARELFASRDDAQLVELYRRGSLPAELLAKIARHIEQYGDRSMEELKMENPSLRDDPTVLFRGIRRFVKSELNVAACRRAELDKRAAAEQALGRRFGRFSPRKALLRWMLHHLREVIAHRENSRYCRSELFGICRDIFHAHGEHLASKRAIGAPQDVLYLTIEEIMGYADGTGVDERFQDTVARRKRQMDTYRRQEVPETIVTDGPLRDNALARAKAAPTCHDRELRGLGSSMGLAKGAARIVLDPTGVDELPPQSILVARETDPGWLFLMLASTGIVVERGSMLSHTAITGRKFGIPTVVGVDGACSRIADGAMLEIDGGSGVVKILQ